MYDPLEMQKNKPCLLESRQTLAENCVDDDGTNGGTTRKTKEIKHKTNTGEDENT